MVVSGVKGRGSNKGGGGGGGSSAKEKSCARAGREDDFGESPI